MSPEQVQSFDLTNRSDLYSLGAVMYELLTGARPFRAGNLQKLLHQIVYATPPPIHTLRKDISEELENVCCRGAAEGAGEALQERRSISPPSSPAATRSCARRTRASTGRSSSACCAG